MSAVTIIAGIAFIAMFGGVVVAWWRGQKHLFSFLLVASVATLAIALGHARGWQYRDQNAVIEVATRPPATPAATTPTGSAIASPTPAAMITELSGSATPPALGNPGAGYP